MIKFFQKNWGAIFLAFFILVAGILRFYHITNLEFFTYDQARDALFVKRMIVDGEFRLLGTQTSLPGMYLPPFYYYTIAPILWVFGLNPVGLDIYSAFIGVLSVPLIYFIANRIFGRPAGIFSAGLFAVSPIIVELTRRAWNPNTLPFFILITFYFVYRYFQTRSTKHFLLAFGFYGYSLSLHFGSWTLLPLFLVVWLMHWKYWGIKRLWGLLGGLGILIFFVSPLLIFEIRHSFFLVKQAKMFFFDGGHIGLAVTNMVESFISSLVVIFTILISGKIMVGYGAPLEFLGRLKDLFILNQSISVVAQKPFSLSFQWWGIVVLLLIVIFSFVLLAGQLKDKTRLAVLLLWIWVVFGVFISRFYSGSFFFFYYLYLFPVPILLFGFVYKKLSEVPYFKVLTFLSFFLIITFHLRYTTVFTPTWRNIDDLKKVAEVVSNDISNQETFNVATIQKEADRWDRNAVDYRYFIETFYEKRALDWQPEYYRQASILYVVSEGGEADPLNSPIMEIVSFQPKKVVKNWVLPKNVVVYKLEK